MKWTAWGMETNGEAGREGHLLLIAEAEKEATRAPVVVNLLIDRSGSMKGAPLAAAIEAAQQLVDQAGPEDFLGLLVFDAVAEQRVPMMPMAPKGKRQMMQALSEIVPGKGTALHQAVDMGAQALNRLLVPGRRPKLLLLTDGEPSVGHESEVSFQDLGQKVARSGVGVHALGLGRHYLPEILAALTLPSENAFEHVDGPDGLPVAMGAVFALLFGEVVSSAQVLVKPEGFMSLSCRHGFPTLVEGESLVVGLGAISRGMPRRVLLSGGLGGADWSAQVTGLYVEKGDQRRVAIPVQRVWPDAREGKLVLGVGLELDLVTAETGAWLALAQKDPDRAGGLLGQAEQAMTELSNLVLDEIAVGRHMERLKDLRGAIERGEGDIPMLVRRAKSAKTGTHVSQVIPLEPRYKKN
ncbi:MAG TPA: VWA domain-containing protein [Myxococcaceae bacterium]|nr:VWA domain-containing protein [Myxococcaceae bacterium]